MKLFLVGEFLPARLELSFENAFRALGCQVMVFDTGIKSRFLSVYWERIINKNLLKNLDLFKPDLTLVIKGYFLRPRTIAAIKEKNKCQVYCFNSDNPFNILSYGSSNKNILDSVLYYDCYFTFSRQLIEKIKKRGAKKVEYLPFGFDPQLHYPVEVSTEERKNFANDIVFLGNWDVERERWLKHLKDFDLGIWGEDYWLRFCKDRDLRLRWHRQAMYGENQSKVLNSSKISLNILRVQNKGSHNMRTFEAPACGAFVLSERSPEIVEFFKEDKEAVYFSTPEELREKARYYLGHPQERETIAKAGYQHCISGGYSYLDRARYTLNVYSNLSARPAP